MPETTTGQLRDSRVHEQPVAHAAATLIPPGDSPHIYPGVISSPVSVLPDTATGQLRDSGNIGPDEHVESSPVSMQAVTHSMSHGELCYVSPRVRNTIYTTSTTAYSMPQVRQSSPGGRVASGGGGVQSLGSVGDLAVQFDKMNLETLAPSIEDAQGVVCSGNQSQDFRGGGGGGQWRHKH